MTLVFYFIVDWVKERIFYFVYIINIIKKTVEACVARVNA
jgi:hypothetical protein